MHSEYRLLPNLEWVFPVFAITQPAIARPKRVICGQDDLLQRMAEARIFKSHLLLDSLLYTPISYADFGKK